MKEYGNAAERTREAESEGDMEDNMEMAEMGSGEMKSRGETRRALGH